jgi:O-antigen ligase
MTNSKPSNSKLFVALLITVFIMPWPHGGEVAWQYLFFTTGIFTLATIYFVNNSQKLSSKFTNLNSIKTPLILLSAWLLFQVLQVIPLPFNIAHNLTTITALSITEASINTNHWQTISIAPNLTLVELIKNTSYLTVFILALLLLNTKQRILTLANTLFFGSAIIALYSLINHYTKGAFDLVSSIPPWTAPWERATHGTFSYQNHYASFLTLTIPLGYGLMYANLKKRDTQQLGKTYLNKMIDLISSVNGIYLLSLLIMVTALFKTASRGGNSIFVISIALTYLCVLLQQKKSKKQKVKKVLLLLISMLAIGIFIFTTGVTNSLTNRLDSQGYKPNGRDIMHQTAFAIIKESPIVGTGAGTYPILQHKYKSSLLGTSAMSKRAHNDYLELLANQGIIGFSLLAMATLLLLRPLSNGLKKGSSKRNKNLYGLQVGSFCGVIAILLHSLADFNFHLPVNAVYFYLLVAIGIKIPLLKTKE